MQAMAAARPHMIATLGTEGLAAMLERLGHVLGWTGNLVAALIISGNALMQLSYRDWEWSSFLFTAGIAVVIFLIGRALRYILAGPSRSIKNRET